MEGFQKQVRSWIKGNVSACARSVFIFDELDKLDVQVLDAVKPFIDHHSHLDGVDYRKSVFIFLRFLKFCAYIVISTLVESVLSNSTTVSLFHPWIPPNIVICGIFSNTGGNDITQRTLEYFQSGKPRERISLHEMEEIITVAAYNEEGRFFPTYLPLLSHTVHKI